MSQTLVLVRVMRVDRVSFLAVNNDPPNDTKQHERKTQQITDLLLVSLHPNGSASILRVSIPSGERLRPPGYRLRSLQSVRCGSQKCRQLSQVV
jgi:hypothetical protein